VEPEPEDTVDPPSEPDPESEPLRESEPSTPEARECESEIICVAPSADPDPPPPLSER
jgi:hypothetical protein